MYEDKSIYAVVNNRITHCKVVKIIVDVEGIQHKVSIRNVFETRDLAFSELIKRKRDECTNLEKQLKFLEQAKDSYSNNGIESWDKSNKGKRWTDEDHVLIKDLFDSGMDIKSMAAKLQRSYGGIIARLVFLKIITEEESHLLYKNSRYRR
jgi:hypothetical protein